MFRRVSRGFSLLALIAMTLTLSACGGGGGGGAVSGVNIDNAPTSGQLALGSSLDLDATVNVTGGASQAVTWASSNSSVATVDSDGVVTGKAVGTTTITATSNFDRSKQDSVALEVVTSPVTAVAVTPETASVSAGDTVQLSAVVEGNAGVSQEVTWSSDKTGVATVDANGLVTGLSSGTATITATSTVDPSKSGSAVVTVVSCGTTQELTSVSAPTTLVGVPGCTDYVVNQGEVNVTAALNIQPGVTIAFKQGSRLDVEAGGSITANGTSAQPITFTGQTDVAGFWNGIRIFSAIPSALENVVVAYGGGDGSSDAANIEVGSGGRLNLKNSTLRHSAGYGLTLQPAGNLTGFATNTLPNNKAAARIYVRHLPQLDNASNYTQDNTDNFIDVNGGTTDADGTWPATNAPYRLIAGEINVVNVIMVEAGLDFRFQAGSRLDIETGGSLSATGSSAGITFRGASQTAGFWNGIRIFSTIPSIFDNVTFADGGGDGSVNAATVEIGSNGQASFENSSFVNSKNYGLTVESGGDLSGFSSNDFSSNRVPMRVFARHLMQLDNASTFADSNTENFIDINGGNTDAGGIWPAARTPYRVIAGEMNVINAVTIEDGAVFQFQAGSRLDLESGGSLTASGAATGIVFTGTSQVKGHWTGIRIFAGASANFDNVTVSYGGGNGSSSAANIYVNQGTLTLTNSTVSSSANFGLYVTGASASVTPDTEAAMLAQNTFSNNTVNVFGLP